MFELILMLLYNLLFCINKMVNFGFVVLIKVGKLFFDKIILFGKIIKFFKEIVGGIGVIVLIM